MLAKYSDQIPKWAGFTEGRQWGMSRALFLLARCHPSWPPSPEIRTAHAKVTDFHVCVFRISGLRGGVAGVGVPQTEQCARDSGLCCAKRELLR